MIEGQKKRITRKKYQRLVNKFEMEGLVLWRRKACGTLRERKVLSEKRRVAKGRG